MTTPLWHGSPPLLAFCAHLCRLPSAQPQQCWVYSCKIPSGYAACIQASLLSLGTQFIFLCVSEIMIWPLLKAPFHIALNMHHFLEIVLEWQCKIQN